MTDADRNPSEHVDRALQGLRQAIEQMALATARCEREWPRQPAAGGWSPAQVAEHVARAIEESANVVAGVPSKFPHLPRLVRPLLRLLFFNRILRGAPFPKARTSRALEPVSGAETPAEACLRLRAVVDRMEQVSRERKATEGSVNSPIVGTVPLADFIRLQELHARHHCRQMLRAAGQESDVPAPGC